MPETLLSLQVDPSNATPVLETHGYGTIETTQPNQWIWRAPAAPGRYTLTIHAGDSGTAIRLNVFVKTPFDNSGDALDGYRIGRYETSARPGDARSAPPAGLVKVTPTNRNTRLSAHFRLGEFPCHQQPAHWPKYVLVRPHLLEKLERLSDLLADEGVPADALTIMSGFRTPWYNADIGNTTVYSQHLFGSAADVFVDRTGDGRMDDLNGDGRIDVADAEWLADRVAALAAEHPALQGGLSAYPGNAQHGPFVHLDVRGVPARW